MTVDTELASQDPHRGAERAFIFSGLLPLAPKDDATDPREAAHRAALATLRRGLGKEPGTVIEMYRYVSPYLPAGASPEEENAYFLIAALFAMHPHQWPPSSDRRPTNIGASFAQLVVMLGDGANDSVEGRFAALLGAAGEALQHHLRQAVSLLRSKEIPVDYLQLLRDVQRWDWEDRIVQRRWAGAFWGTASTSRETEANTEVPVIPANDLSA